MRKLLMMFSILAVTALGTTRESEAATITVDSGWVASGISSASDLMEFSFTLASAGVFSLTDCCNTGDIWTISGDIAGASSIGLALVSVPLGIGDYFVVFDPVWLDPARAHFQVALAAGTYNISVAGDCGGGCPASFGVRADLAAVPVPAAGLLLAFALGGLGLVARRRNTV